ncbi:hypothetical protein MJO28_014791 [Puccinia striiformis f. sp. tritici]|uniref:Uncharacterized protein n=1 Tax=Puccinia striiformis f. sp. tritici TaxID=168172 RepID=A0ACC0DUX7_9BASI|nr:hypothetical protein MJO28_014791 [Puccinia striiformis f. sp. tritici]
MVLAAGAPKQPDPKTTVVFTCANFVVYHSGWCIAGGGKDEFDNVLYHFVQANAVGPDKDFNYNCINKKYGDNSACCDPNFKPKPNDLYSLTGNCKIKKSNGT